VRSSKIRGLHRDRRHRNLTRASAYLRRSLQSVSGRSTALEAQVGVVLIRRTTRTAEPPRRASHSSPHQRGVSRDSRWRGRALRHIRNVAGHARIAGSAVFVGPTSFRPFETFRFLHPGVKFDLRIARRVHGTGSHGVDIMIRLGSPSAPRGCGRAGLPPFGALRSLRPSYVAQRGQPKTPTDLARHACLIRSSAQDARAWTFHARDGTPHRFPVESVFEADNAHVTMHAALAGMGIAVIPFYHVREAVEAGLAEIVLDDFTLAPSQPTRCGRRARERHPAYSDLSTSSLDAQEGGRHLG